MLFIFKKMGKYLNKVIFSLIIKAIGSIADVVLPFLLAYMIDEMIPNLTPTDLLPFYLMGALMFAVAILGWVFNIMANRSAEDVASRSVADTRSELFSKIERLDAKQVDQITTTSYC